MCILDHFQVCVILKQIGLDKLTQKDFFFNTHRIFCEVLLHPPNYQITKESQNLQQLCVFTPLQEVSDLLTCWCHVGLWHYRGFPPLCPST